jgi:hypothetical protein
MQELTFAPQIVNFTALNADLRAALGSAFVGVSAGPYGIRVHLADDATPEQIAQAKNIVLTHDPTRLTPEQQADQQRAQQLEQARHDNAVPLDIKDYQNASALTDAALNKLAAKVAWLEQEIAAIRSQ